MGALINPANTRNSIKWGLVAHTMAMFSFITLFTAFNFEIQSTSYINNRSFVLGPLGYQFMGYKVINAIPSIVFMLNNWLADGLLVSSASNSVTHVAKQAAPPGVSLLCRLLQELSIRYLPMHNVPRLCRYVLESLQSCGDTLV